mmetsp:Transcript_2747/g.6037  ORF Transcript_2747/g.6037 Transcript_2747/m.6037 type:complete len:361 (-) Transcript_2747:2165-3247(-)
MACMRASKLLMSKPWMWISSGTGLTPGGKLNSPWLLAPIQSPTSLALARLWLSATIRILLSVCALMYRMRLVMTSSTGPRGPPRSCISSTRNRDTACTFLRCFHLRDSMSHLSAVLMMMLPLSRALRSALVSPLSCTTLTPSPSPNRLLQSSYRSLARASMGAMYTHLAVPLPSDALLSMRSTANSPQMVLPLPVGAATRALSSVLYRAVKTWVWMGLKVVRPLYRASNAALRSALTGRGCRSSSSVGGGNFSGRMRWRKETGSVLSHCSHLSDTTLIKYWGGTGSAIGTVKLRVCSSSENDFLSTQYWLYSTCSLSWSSTSTQNGSTYPCSLSSHLKSGVMVRSTLSMVRVIGCTWAAS